MKINYKEDNSEYYERRQRGRSYYTQITVDQFSPWVFYVGLGLFLAIGIIVSENFFNLPESILKIVLHISFLCISTFILFFGSFTSHEDDRTNYEVSIPIVIYILLGIAIPYATLISIKYFPLLTDYCFWTGLGAVVIVAIFSLFDEELSFFGKVVTSYSVIANFLTISVSYYDFGVKPLSYIENFLPFFKDLRLILGLLTILLVFIYGLTAATKMPRPNLPLLPKEDFPNTSEDKFFLAGIFRGIQKVVIRVWNITSSIINRVFILVGYSLYYLFYAVVKIFEEILLLIKSSKFIVIANSFMFLSFLICSYSITIGDAQFQYLIGKCENCDTILKSIGIDFVVMSSLVLALSLIYLLYNSGFEKEIINSNLLKLLDETIQSFFMILVFFGFTGFILWGIANGLGWFNQPYLTYFKNFGTFNLWSSILLGGILLIYGSYMLIKSINNK